MKKKRPLANCFFCEKDKRCDFNVFVGKCYYACCVGCVREAKKDGYSIAERVE